MSDIANWGFCYRQFNQEALRWSGNDNGAILFRKGV